MKKVAILSAAEQVASYIKQEVLSGGLTEEMPGIHRLAAELGVNHKTVTAALRLLQKDGTLVAGGKGRPSVITKKGTMHGSLRIGIVPYDSVDRGVAFMTATQHELELAGHRAFFHHHCLIQMGMDLGRISRLVDRNEADAWVVETASKEVLEWFSEQGKPVMALFGRRRELPIAGVGPDKPPAMAEATKALLKMGHRRIVMLARRVRRLPKPGATEQAFLDTLSDHGIATGKYHLPDWDDDAEGLHVCLEAMFRVSPPTAMIVDEPCLFFAVQKFLGNKGLKVPKDVSLMCTDNDLYFEWCRPSIAHIHWECEPLVRRILQWAKRVNLGQKDLRQTLTPTKFVNGGSIGSASR